MKITAVKQQAHCPQKYNVFVDGAFAFSLIKEDIIYFKLKEGNEIAQEKYDFIQNELIYIQAQDKALHYIGYKMRTEKEVCQKLYQKGFAENVVQRVMEFLKKYEYVDDEKYCEGYIKERLLISPRAKYALKMELRQRGVLESTICKVLDKMDIDELGDAVRLLEKKCFYLDDMNEKEKKRLFGFLQRRGYCYDIIKEAFAYVQKKEE